jgi:hypothetical protein
VNPSSSAYWQLSHRDGTSQAQRLQAALDPDYVSIDERSLKDLLAFVQKLANDIRYWDVESDQLRDMGDWSAFLGPDMHHATASGFVLPAGAADDQKAERPGSGQRAG